MLQKIRLFLFFLFFFFLPCEFHCLLQIFIKALPLTSFVGSTIVAFFEQSSDEIFQIRYGEPVIRRAVPLALALISTSNPQLSILESLSKFSHDADAETAHNAIFAMGLVGAGTNNARLVSMLRQLASYHHKDQVNKQYFALDYLVSCSPVGN